MTIFVKAAALIIVPLLLVGCAPGVSKPTNPVPRRPPTSALAKACDQVAAAMQEASKSPAAEGSKMMVTRIDALLVHAGPETKEVFTPFAKALGQISKATTKKDSSKANAALVAAMTEASAKCTRAGSPALAKTMRMK